MNGLKPTFKEEKRLRRLGYKLIAGIDEVGRGALAGPVAAAAVILPPRLKSGWADEVRDSKQLTPEAREELYPHIMAGAVAAAVGFISHEVIDYVGILPATKLAMKAAVEQLDPAPEYLLLDYLVAPDIFLPQKGVEEGDSLCLSIACASIVAKVSRDRLMKELDGSYPGYGLAGNKGYGTGEHLACLVRLGPSPVHRRSFRPELADES